jgi:hypothetical protein
MNEAVLAYAEFRPFWERFSPDTPFGREDKERLTVYTDPAALEAIWDLTEAALALLDQLQSDPLRASRIAHHLKRLPRFPVEPRPCYGEVDLFQFKKFLFNYRSLMELLGHDGIRAFGFSFASEPFLRLLDTGRQGAESFYVADDYCADLKATRAELRDLAETVRTQRLQRLERICADCGLDFGPKEFLLVPRAALADPAAAAALLTLEAYDEQHWLARPLASGRELLLAERREGLLARERALEEAVLETLSHAARQELETLLGYQETVRRFDLAFARARLARQAGLTRPVLAPGPVVIEGGRFPSCEEACRDLGSPYRPLDARFDGGVTVLFGSNMGGKTVVLKTLAFLQLCVQTGLFAPARSFATRVFSRFHYVGEGGIREAARGLSGFGVEIRQFNEVCREPELPALALFDEFARTTQSREAEALLSGILETFRDRAGLLALFSTHFRGVARLTGVRYLRMAGLDRAALRAGATGDDPLRTIARHMDYRLAEDDGSREPSDALAVAALLGLDPAIGARAEHFFRQGS